MNIFSRGSLELFPRERLIWVYPEQGDGALGQSSIDGYVELTLPRPATIPEITVRLLGEATVVTLQRQTTGIVCDKSVTCYRSDGKKIEAGKHRFNYLLPIESSMPTSLLPRYDIGTIQYRMIATAGSHKAEMKMAVISCSTEKGARANVLDVQVQDVTHDLGALRLQWLSSRFTCGSLFETKLDLIELPRSMTLLGGSIWLVDTLIKRHYDSHGLLEEAEEQNVKEDRLSQLAEHLELTIDGSKAQPAFPLELSTGNAFSLQHYTRMPSTGLHRQRPGPKIRYTFPRNALTPIRSNYELRFRLDFRIAGHAEPLRLEIQRHVEVGSCLLVDENTNLPEYGDLDTVSGPEEAPRVFALAADWGSRASEKCVCQKHFDELLAEHLAQSPETSTSHAEKDVKTAVA